MGKGNRHKKNLKLERSKVKLKGKELPKGGNVTNTTFKVKKIIVGEQLKNVGENGISFDSQIKDYLSKLRHHNSKICMASLLGLKSVLNKYPRQIRDNQFGSILKNLARLTTCEDRDVRRESFTIMLALLEPVVEENEDNLKPYYDILASYLCCAMTHIDIKIQNDSLLFMDVLLKTVPLIIVDNYARILDNFLDMISKLRTEAKPERSLSMNLNSSITSVKWRVKVLQKLQCMLQVLVNTKMDDKINKKNDNTNICSTINQSIKVSDYDYNTPSYLGITHPNYLKIVDLSLFSGIKTNIDTCEIQENVLENKVETLMPLLFETWLEVKLNNTKDSSGCYKLDMDSSALLMSILEIMLSFQYLVQRNVKRTEYCFEKYLKNFISFIVDGFPYSQFASTRKGNLADVGRNIDCLRQNLYICHIFLVFNTNMNFKQKGPCEIILKYIRDCLYRVCNRPELVQDVQGVLEDILHSLFFRVSPKLIKMGLLMDILESLIEFMESITNSDTRVLVFRILCGISEKDLKHFYMNPKYFSWLQSLPSMLCRNITPGEISCLSTLARHNNSVFLENVLAKFPSILDALSCSNNSYLVCSIINIIYYVSGLTQENLLSLKNAVNISNIPDVDKCYLNTILHNIICNI